MILFFAGCIFGFVLACVIAGKRVKLAEDTLLNLRRQKQDHPDE